MKYYASLGREWVVAVIVVTVVVVVAVVVVVVVVVVVWRRRVPCSPGRGSGGDAVIETTHEDCSGAGTGGGATDARGDGGGARAGN